MRVDGAPSAQPLWISPVISSGQLNCLAQQRTPTRTSLLNEVKNTNSNKHRLKSIEIHTKSMPRSIGIH